MKRYIPDLMGVFETTRFLGVSRQYVNQLIREKKLEPVLILKCGKIFLKEDIEEFEKTRKKRDKK